MPRSLTQITDLTAAEVREILDLCGKMKRKEIAPKPLAGKAVACIFTKASLRTRVSFEVGIQQLGGNALYITDNEIKLGERESIADAARVLSRYVGMIMIRTYKQSDVEGLAKHASVPVVNGLTDAVHPCQILGDYFTILEHKPPERKYKVAYLGDGNNITHSWLNLASLIPLDLRIATAPDCRPDSLYVEKARRNPQSSVLLTDDPKEAVAGADVVYTDVWASMGQKHLAEEKANKLRSFQVNSSLLKGADPGAIVLHCLPAERGKEITDEVMDGPQSVVFDEAENRLHIQKAIMAFLLK
ncbi:ornithine carbamoyltransferase [candidate division GN15 bacterium]|uniref:Ornithine carbamoyltransferase n=1 Tax=candidate division GN15 bacterium TaxID=2072418 RepID=A0A855WWR6_9BACT|nr:MAG: ornithine carbamoyltransferase [candidate division GN15 bacterium]